MIPLIVFLECYRCIPFLLLVLLRNRDGIILKLFPTLILTKMILTKTKAVKFLAATWNSSIPSTHTHLEYFHENGTMLSILSIYIILSFYLFPPISFRHQSLSVINLLSSLNNE
ncbi:hypothetical protein OCU04_008224 [Sclerotinia nivalis]|uniref:Uncharacterized protein n=1 Tax=Sclerotinia nivalis TaxID=352851 RepID=A0A9X0AIQ8_9HELO|nr:hypothetical protein OCU04_008224 [Sclerotinia nivalis]